MKIMNEPEAQAMGYATFGDVDTACIEVPDSEKGFVISARTSEGKRLTFAFLPYKEGGPPQCVDIVYHDSPKPKVEGYPTFDVLAFGKGPTAFDSRKSKIPVTVASILLDPHPED